MERKSYPIAENEPITINEPTIAYHSRNEPTIAYHSGNEAAVTYRNDVSSSDNWNPNVPIHCTQKDFLEHIHHIEAGNFTPWEEAKKEFEAWKSQYLISRLK